MTMSLFLASIAISLVAGTLSVCLHGSESAAKVAGCWGGIVAAALSLMAGVGAVLGATARLSEPFLMPFTNFTLQVGPLEGLMVAIISTLALAAFIYGLSYFDEYAGKIGRACMFLNYFVASMLLVITADNAFWFLVFFELMSLTSYFLVTIEGSQTAVRGGLVYLIMAHVGFVLIMVSFLTMAVGAGSLEFEAFRALDLSPAMASLCFVLAFFGFGCKAGIIPLHSWLPKAHPEAPSNVSALMSGGMIKIGIFGIVKVGFDLLGTSGAQLWWGFVVLAIGAISSVLGVVYALAEHDIKRLLAYHSVENIGIILLGVGVALVGSAMDNPVLAGLGLVAALFHTVNHAMFKGELFLGAGAMLFSVHTRNMEEMGGLFRRMPWTAVCFLVGSLAISAIPPLNGFASEWLTYQSMFDAAFLGGRATLVFAVLSAVALAITGALAVTCFVKAYGVSFSGAPRSHAAALAREVPAPMVVAQVLLAVMCVVLGLGAPLVVPALAGVANATLSAGNAGVVAASGAQLINQVSGTAVSNPLIFVLLVSAFVVGLIVVRALSAKAPAARTADPWACGYQSEVAMQPIATTFASNVENVMAPLYTLRQKCTDLCWAVARFFQRLVGVSIKAEPVMDRVLVDDVVRGVNTLSAGLPQKIMNGAMGTYVGYIVAGFVLFLVLAIVL